MTFDNCVVYADNLAVWEGATVVYADNELKIYVPTTGGGVDLDETFSNVDVYELNGNRTVFSSTTNVTDDDGNQYSRVTVRPIRACGSCGSR